MTWAGRIQQLTSDLSSLSKPKTIMVWNEVREARNLLREINYAISDLDDEVTYIKKGDVTELLHSHHRLEMHVGNAMDNFEALFKNTWIELVSIRNVLRQQQIVVKKLEPVFDKGSLRKMQIELEEKKKQYKQLLSKISNLSTTELQRNLV